MGVSKPSQILSYSKREDPLHSHTQIKAKPKSNGENTRDSLVILCLQRPWASLLLCLCRAQHAACLVGLGQLHSALDTVLDGYPMVLVSLIGWGVHCNWGYTFASGLLRPLQGFQLLEVRVNFSPWPLPSCSLHDAKVSTTQGLSFARLCFQLWCGPFSHTWLDHSVRELTPGSAAPRSFQSKDAGLLVATAYFSASAG